MSIIEKINLNNKLKVLCLIIPFLTVSVWAQNTDEGIVKAIRDLETACNSNDSQFAESCFLVGKYYSLINTEKDKKLYKKTVNYFNKACSLNHFEACEVLGGYYEYGFYSVSEDLDKAANYYDKACKGENLSGCTSLGVLFLKEKYKKKDVSKAIELLSATCKKEHHQACLKLAYCYDDDKLGKRDIGAALSYFQKACDLGDSFACHELGTKYLEGVDVERNREKAKGYFRSGCLLKLGASCFAIGKLQFIENKFIEKETTRKPDWHSTRVYFESACYSEFGNAAGCNFLGYLTENGLGARLDISKAKELYGRACDLGDQDGCDSYSRLSKEGL